MRASIDMTKCSGHARCNQVDPELFKIDDIGYALRSEFAVPAGAEDTAREAAASCPERAITLLTGNQDHHTQTRRRAAHPQEPR